MRTLFNGLLTGVSYLVTGVFSLAIAAVSVLSSIGCLAITVTVGLAVIFGLLSLVGVNIFGGSSSVDDYAVRIEEVAEAQNVVEEQFSEVLVSASAAYERGELTRFEAAFQISQAATGLLMQTLDTAQEWSAINPPSVAETLHQTVQRSYDALIEGLDDFQRCILSPASTCTEAVERMDESDELRRQAFQEILRLTRDAR